MADDIDIEEHDLLDNPQIKNIFPDLTRIKAEVLHEEDEFPYEDFADYNSSVPIKVEPTNVELIEYPQIGSKIILGSKPCPTIVPKTERRDNDTSTAAFKETSTPAFMETQKSNERGVKENLDAYVLVEDWGPMLNNSPCFCKDCLILFDTVNTFDAHKVVVHSLLAVVPSVNKAIKSTAKSSTDGLLVCNHCNKKFPDNSSLIKHLYMVMDQPKVEEKSAVKVIDKVVCYKCMICTSYFKYPEDFKTHVIANHKVKIINLKTSFFNKNCAFCPFVGKNISSYNFHIISSHTNISAGILKSGKLINYKCTLCDLFYESLHSFYRHKAKVHAHVKYKHLSKKVFVDLKTLKYPQGFTSCNDDNTKEKKSILPYNVNKLKQVPILHLFKCGHCNVYLLFSHAAKAHVGQCTKNQVFKTTLLIRRCSKCPRKFRDIDMSLHQFQHTLTNNFKVLTINNAKSSETCMYECGVCHVVFDSLTFNRHTNLCDGTSRGQYCPYCKLSVPRAGFIPHVNKHSRGNHIIIKCILVKDGVKPEVTPLKRKIEVKTDVNPMKRKIEEVKESPQKFQKISENSLPGPSSDSSVHGKRPFYYCNNCKAVTLRKKKSHSSGKCLYAKTRLCTECGLNIHIKKGNHAKLHATTKFTLHDIILYDYHDNIVPIPMSEFYSCISCQIYFVSKKTLLQHECGKLRFKVCKICDKTFESHSYKLHYAFHAVNPTFSRKVAAKSTSLDVPDLLMRYESLQAIWNILYQCSVCNTVTDSYDVAVEHSQAHYSQMESFGVILLNCDICKLAFKSDCHQKHIELHQRAKLNLNSFNILQFNYLHLQSAKWFHMFNSLESKIVDMILSNSVYNETRSVRFKVLQNGVNGKTVYLCDGCCRIVASEDVKAHAFNKNICSNLDYQQKCNICQYKFATEATFNRHNNPHEIEAYRILVFNSEDDKTILDAMKKNAVNEVGMTVAKNLVENIVDTHNKDTGNDKTYDIKPEMQEVKKNGQGKYVYYCCIKCKMGVSRLKSMFRHRCMTAKKRKFNCSECNMLFLNQHYKQHMLLHKKLYGPSTNKICIEHFQPKAKGKNAAIIKKKSSAEGSPKKVDKITIKLFTKRPDPTLYKCGDCDICFLNKKAMRYHFNNHERKIKTDACKDCGLRFKIGALIKHRSFHHNVPNFKLADFKIVSHQTGYPVNELEDETEPTETEQDINDDNLSEDFNDSQDIQVEKANSNEISLRALYKCYLCPVHTPNIDTFQKHLNNHANNTKIEYRPCKHCGLDFTETYCNYHERKHQKTDFTKIPVIKNAIAYCAYCKVYLQNFMALRSHNYKHNAGISFTPTPATKCSICKLNVATCNFEKHMEYIHVKNKLTAKDLFVLSVDDTPGTSDEQKRVEDERVLYKCIECSVLLVDKTNHDHKDKSQAVSVKCDDCKKDILESQLSLHKTLHHSQEDTVKFSIKTLIILYKCSQCSLCSHDYDTMEYHMKNHSRRAIAKQKTYTCSICEYSFSFEQYKRHTTDFHNSNQKLEEIQVVECQVENTVEAKNNDDEDGKVMETSNNDDKVPITKKYKIKLYKCSECNVCFLSQGVCYKHVLKHVALDCRGFVECKICSLQFSLMIFHKHMKKHHIDDDFDLEDVLIESYTPNANGSPKIELYYAVDRVQSELVSTTSEVTQSNTTVDNVSENGQ